MADLIAQGDEPQQRWRRRLREGESFVIGRAAGSWAVPWEEHASREHAQLCWREGRLEVRRLASGRNPVFLRGQEQDEFHLAPGEHFVIGETSFTLSEEEVAVARDAPHPLEEKTFTAQHLRNVRFHNADHRLDVLSRLPDVISGAASDDELHVRMVNMLMSGIPRAGAVALVSTDPQARDDASVDILHWDRRLSTTGAFQPSRGLILEAVRRGQSVLHVWGGAPDAHARGPSFTINESFDWAFAAPILGAGCEGWVFYVAGRFRSELPMTPDTSTSADLREELKFTEIVAGTLSSLRQVGRLQRKQAVLSQFLPPAVMEALDSQDAQTVLAHRETDVSVLFCDLRGFSRKAEQDSGDLIGLLQRVSQALGVMTHRIHDQGGVIGDFHGDAAMGFWGWPLPQEDLVQRAVLAALSIRQEFVSAALRPGDSLADFRIGIGLATGRAVAGAIGTSDQQKVTVFGPVVNLASRLEGMTKLVHAPILIDAETARVVRERIPATQARCRRVAVVQPYGMETSLEISELLPPEADYPELTDKHLQSYEKGLDAFLEGRWPEALELLHDVPARDHVKDFLTVYIAQNNRTPPKDWKGVIELSSKS